MRAMQEFVRDHNARLPRCVRLDAGSGVYISNQSFIYSLMCCVGGESERTLDNCFDP